MSAALIDSFDAAAEPSHVMDGGLCGTPPSPIVPLGVDVEVGGKDGAESAPPALPSAAPSTTVDPVEHLRALLGEDTVLLPVARGQKRPVLSSWQKTTVAETRLPSYERQLRAGNIGVLLGPLSASLCSIDFDTDEAADLFLTLNPELQATLRTRGSRGCNLWIKVDGDYPRSAKFHDGEPLGEWRAEGNQTVIYGEHPSGCRYQILHEAPPMLVPFQSLKWPASWALPWTKSAAVAPPSPTFEPLPAAPPIIDFSPIILPGGKISITECADHLFPRIALSKTLFFRGGAITELEVQDDGTTGLAVIKPCAFRSRIEGFGQLMAWRVGANGGEVLKPTPCPEETAKALMETLEAREHLPKIATVINCPVALEVDEELAILGRGYHPDNGGILVVGGEVPPELPIGEAVNALVGVLNEFDFQTLGDRSRALASLITPALKLGGFITGSVPADVAEADQSQSGKTYRQRVGCAIYNETPTLIAARKGGVGSVDESFSQALISGRPFIQLDNVRGKLDSPYIEAFLTAVGGFGARVPHRGEVQVDSQRFMILMTSNGVESTRDFANRSSIIRIRKRAGYQYVTYLEGDLLRHVKARQSYYLGCVFSVIREWMEFGKPRTSVTEHDFKEWAQTLDWIVQNVFAAAPLLEGHQRAQERVSNPALSFLRVVALEVQAAAKLGVSIQAGDIVDLCEEAGIEIPGFKFGDSVAARQRVGAVIGRAFGAADILQLQIDEFTVTRANVQQVRSGGGSYSTKSYVFAK